MLLTNYSELHNQTCTITTLSPPILPYYLPHTSVITTLKYYLTILFYHTIYHILVLLQHYQTNLHTIYHTLVILPHYQTIYPCYFTHLYYYQFIRLIYHTIYQTLVLLPHYHTNLPHTCTVTTLLD